MSDRSPITQVRLNFWLVRLNLNPLNLLQYKPYPPMLLGQRSSWNCSFRKAALSRLFGKLGMQVSKSCKFGFRTGRWRWIGQIPNGFTSEEEKKSRKCSFQFKCSLFGLYHESKKCRSPSLTIGGITVQVNSSCQCASESFSFHKRRKITVNGLTFVQPWCRLEDCIFQRSLVCACVD